MPPLLPVAAAGIPLDARLPIPRASGESQQGDADRGEVKEPGGKGGWVSGKGRWVLEGPYPQVVIASGRTTAPASAAIARLSAAGARAYTVQIQVYCDGVICRALLQPSPSSHSPVAFFLAGPLASWLSLPCTLYEDSKHQV